MMSSNENSKKWNPARYTEGYRNSSSSSNKYALVILNQPLENKSLLIKLCAGGTLCSHRKDKMPALMAS